MDDSGRTDLDRLDGGGFEQAADRVGPRFAKLYLEADRRPPHSRGSSWRRTLTLDRWTADVSIDPKPAGSRSDVGLPTCPEPRLHRQPGPFHSGRLGGWRAGHGCDDPTARGVAAGRSRWTGGPGRVRRHLAGWGDPARLIPAWQWFLDTRSSPCRPVRGIGEPIWPGRRSEEILESQLHEALLNIAVDPDLLADAPVLAGLSLRCGNIELGGDRRGSQEPSSDRRRWVLYKAAPTTSDAHTPTRCSPPTCRPARRSIVAAFSAHTVGRLQNYIRLEPPQMIGGTHPSQPGATTDVQSARFPHACQRRVCSS